MSRELDREDRIFADALAGALRASEQLDPATARRLASARRLALAQAAHRRPAWVWALPATAAAALLLAILLPWRQGPGPAAAELRAAENLELLTDEMGPEFYRDLEFYQWLEREGTHA